MKILKKGRKSYTSNVHSPEKREEKRAETRNFRVIFPLMLPSPKKQAMQPIDGKITQELRVRFGFTVFPFFSESGGDGG